MALTEDQARLLWLYRDYLRRAGLVVCERVARPDGTVAHRSVPAGRGKELTLGFAHWREEQEGEHEGARSRPPS